MNQWLSLNEISQLYEEKQKYRHICKCGHTVYIANKTGRAECNYCHRLVFKDAKTELEYRMKQNLIKERRNRK